MLLENIKTSSDIKKLSSQQMRMLAQEIRQRLVTVTAKTGGHLAPNLGVVELTLALHAVYNFSKDKIIWDVGHQAYVHKILTGRNDKFEHLRCLAGLSGFPKCQESPYDAFGTGHSSTSISAATGFALARKLRHESYDIVAVIGDGALTGGMAYEALSYAGHLGLPMTVILNDNEMSIDKNVGGINDYLTRMRSDPGYARAKEEFEEILMRIPKMGGYIAEMMDRIKDSVRSALVPGDFFEALGFKYFGPVDGHDIESLKKVLINSRTLGKPVLIHCLTSKGKGYKPAETYPDRFHGTGSFDIKTGKTLDQKKAPSYTNVFADTLIELAEIDQRIVGITAAMGSGTGIGKFSKVFPGRAFDVGIAEQHATTMACGLAAGGLKPVVAIYSTFFQRAYDQIIHDLALQDFPVVLAIDRAGLVGADGPTHHGVFDLSYLRAVPNMTIMAPKDENELRHMLKTAFDLNKPVAVRYPRGSGYGVDFDATLKALPVGQAECLREGKDISLWGIGSMVMPLMEVAEQLEKTGISCSVWNARFAKPIDKEALLQNVSDKKILITAEENSLMGGFGDAVLEVLSDEDISIPTLRFGVPDYFIEQGTSDELKEKIGLDVNSMVKAIQKAWAIHG